MTPRTRGVLIQGGFVLLAGGLLGLALRGVSFDAMGETLRQARYVWVAPLIAVSLLSHLLRAWRWKTLIDALPAASAEASPQRVSLTTAFCSVMIGYMVNYALPRLGEVVRTADLSAKERLPFSGVLGTVVVERILDVVVLALSLMATLLFLLDQSAALEEYFLNPLTAQISQVPAVTLLILLTGLAVISLIYRIGFRARHSPLRHLWNRRLQPLLASFADGLATVLRSPHPGRLVFSSLAIWSCYTLMAYLPLLMFDMVGQYHLSLIDGFCITTLGAVGVAIPSPGGVGSFHYITRVTLVYLFAVETSLAVTYAVFVHGGQLVLSVVLGFLCMTLQGSSLSTLRQRAQTARAG